MMGELKQIMISSLKSLIRSFVKPLLMHPSDYLITQNGFKNKEDMGLELERGLELFFQSKKLEVNYIITHPLPVLFFSELLLLLLTPKEHNICSPPVCTSNDTKILSIQLRNDVIIEKCNIW
jgi:hypothetical protein